MKKNDLFIISTIILLTIITHSYHGLQHDSILYTTQALKHIYTENYSYDIFFQNNSQDNYTIFSTLYSFLIKNFGLNLAALTLTLICQIAFSIALYLICNTILEKYIATITTIFILTIKGSYGADSVFSYTEPFLTARSLAEPITLFSLYFLLMEKTKTSLAFSFIGLLIHPIISIYSATAIIIYSTIRKCNRTTKTTVILFSFFLAIPLLLFSLPLQFYMDAHWYNLVAQRTPFALVSHWERSEISLFLMYSLCFFFTLQATTDIKTKQTSLTFLLIIIIFFSASYIGDEKKISILIQAQLWRVLWIAKPVAIILFTKSFIEAVQSRTNQVYVHAWFIVGVIFHEFYGEVICLTACLVAKFSYHKAVRISPTIKLSVITALTLAIVYLIFRSYQDGRILYYLQHQPSLEKLTLWNDTMVLKILAQSPVGSLAVMIMGYYGLRYKTPNRRKWVLLSIAFIPAILTWDLRTPLEKELYSNDNVNKYDLRNLVPVSSKGLWISRSIDVRIPWLILHRANYASSTQASGIIFSNETAKTLELRLQRLVDAGLSDQCIKWRGCKVNSITSGKITDRGLLYLCSDPELDYVVTSSNTKTTLHKEDIQVGRPFPTQTAYLFLCNQLRKFNNE